MKGTKDPENGFVEWLLKQLQDRQWTLTDLSVKIGDKDVSAIHKIATRQRNLGELKARQIADAFGMSHAELFARAGLIDGVAEDSGGKNETSKRVKHFTELLAEIDDDAEQERVTGLIEAIIRQSIQQHRASGKAPRASRSNRSARP